MRRSGTQSDIVGAAFNDGNGGDQSQLCITLQVGNGNDTDVCGTGPELWLGLDHDCLLRVAKIPLKLCGANESKDWKHVG